ncbi:MAG: FliM/FliN family flagellar motor switch protein [Polymorphobacter sp.]
MNAIVPGPMHGQELADLGAFGAISVRLSVEVGAVKLCLREVLALQVGAVHTLDRRVDQPVDVLINERLIARGEIVAVGDRFGVKLTEIVPQAGG